VKTSVSNDLDQIESLIRAGQIPLARKALNSLESGKLPRELLWRMANLLRRAGLIDRGLRLLNPVVRGDNRWISPSPMDLIEYAVLLVRHGGLEEARQIFAQVDRQRYPEVLLYYSFTLTPEWRYEQTIQPLKDFLATSEHLPYLSMVGRLNLIAALIFCEKKEEAEPLIRQAKSRAEKEKNTFMLASLFELEAQRQLQMGRWAAAELELEQAARFLKSSGTTELLYVRKWQAVLALSQNPKSSDAQKNLAEVRHSALMAHEWETVRDCDFHRVRLNAERNLFEFLACGSPMPNYRERLFRSMSNWIPPTEFYRWRLSGRAVDARFEIHVDHGCTRSGKSILESGQGPHRLLRMLCRDFYRPQRIASLAAEIFPGEYYHPQMTPAKLHQVLLRLREAMAGHKLPIRIDVNAGAMMLRGIRNCTIVKEWREDGNAPNALDTSRLKDAFADQIFTIKQCATALNCSISTASRALKKAAESGICQIERTGRSLRFRLSQNKTAA
jgi:hypothetical protein